MGFLHFPRPGGIAITNQDQATNFLCSIEQFVCHLSCHSVCVEFFLVLSFVIPVQVLQSTLRSEDHTGRAWQEKAEKEHIMWKRTMRKGVSLV